MSQFSTKLQHSDFSPRHRRHVPLRKPRWPKAITVTLFSLALVIGFRLFASAPSPTQVVTIVKPELKPRFVLPKVPLEHFSSFKNYPLQDSVEIDGHSVVLHYSQDSTIQDRIELYLARYRPEHASIMICDLATGQMIGLGERRDSLVSNKPKLSFGDAYPAASLIKILTATAAIAQKGLSPDDSIAQVGAYHTLYWRQLHLENKGNTPKVSLKQAFAHSSNPAFAQLGISVGPKLLKEYGTLFGFNRVNQPPIIQTSRYVVPDSGFPLAEVSCGFTQSTTISPMHALTIARAIGDNGELQNLHYVDSAYENNNALPLVKETGTQIMGPSKIRKLQALMQETIHSGTGRRGFYSNLSRAQLDKLEIGGKTGSLDGPEPKGRYDWFIGYARLKDKPHQGIAITVMLVHTNYQSLRAAHFAALLVREWLREEEKKQRSDA